MRQRINNFDADIVFFPEPEDKYTAFKRMFSTLSLSTILNSLLKEAPIINIHPQLTKTLSYLNTYSKIAKQEKVLVAMPMIYVY